MDIENKSNFIFFFLWLFFFFSIERQILLAIMAYGPKRWPTFYIWAAKKADFLYKTPLQPLKAMLCFKSNVWKLIQPPKDLACTSSPLIVSSRAGFSSMNIHYPKERHLVKLLIWIPSIIITKWYIHHNMIDPLWKHESKIKLIVFWRDITVDWPGGGHRHLHWDHWRQQKSIPSLCTTNTFHFSNKSFLASLNLGIFFLILALAVKFRHLSSFLLTLNVVSQLKEKNKITSLSRALPASAQTCED